MVELGARAVGARRLQLHYCPHEWRHKNKAGQESQSRPTALNLICTLNSNNEYLPN